MIKNFLKSLKHDKHKRKVALAFFLFAVFLVIMTEPYFNSTNVSSRYIAIESIVEDGDFIVDDKHLATGDKIYRDGHYYSSKPPMLILAGSAVYYVAHNFFNQDFPDFDSFSEMRLYSYNFYPVVYLVSLIFVGGTFWLMLLYFYKTLKLLKIESKYHLQLLLGLGLGTLLFSYAVTLNNHTIGASLLFIAFYYLLLIKKDKYQGERLNRYLSLAGLFASLAAVIDLPTGLTFYGLFFLYFLFKVGFKKIFYYVWPFLIIFSVHLYFNYQAFGGFLPAQVYKEYWRGPDGNWINLEASPDFVYRNTWYIYLFNIFIGTHGLFVYTPILILSFYGLYKVIKERGAFFWEALMILFGLLVITVFYTGFSRAYGGFSYGFRWFIAVTPLMYFFIIFLFRQKPSSNLRSWFIILLFCSVIFALIGAYEPWPEGSLFCIGNEISVAPPLVGSLRAIYEHILLMF